MALSCGGSFLKFLVFFFNALVFIGGAVCTGFGAYLVYEARNSVNTVGMGIPAFILATGLLIFLLGFLGCTGACCENSCMLKTFAAIVTVLLLCEIIGGIVVLVYRHQFVDKVGTEMQKLIKKLDEASFTDYPNERKGINELQKELKCCGGVNYTDWKRPPPSCCPNEPPICKNPYKLGCAQAAYEKIKDMGVVIGVSLIVMCLLQIGAIVCACCLSKKIGYDAV